jgi:hypothetical protein
MRAKPLASPRTPPAAATLALPGRTAQVDWTLNKEGLFRGFYANNEVIYDTTKDRVSENRLIPLGLVLRSSEHLETRLFYLWRAARGSRDWRHYHGFGVLASLNY